MFFKQRINADASISYFFGCGGRALSAASGAAYLLHASNSGKAGFTFTPVNHGDELAAGNTKLRILHTPSHTEDSICLLVSDQRRGTAPWFVITGVTLLVGSVGRPDQWHPGSGLRSRNACFACHLIWKFSLAIRRAVPARPANMDAIIAVNLGKNEAWT